MAACTSAAAASTAEFVDSVAKDGYARARARSRRRQLNPKPVLDEELVLERMAELDIKEQHAYTMWRGLLVNKAASWNDVPQLPKALYRMLDEEFALTTSTLVKQSTSADGSTTKLMVELQDGKLVEAVIMRYGSVPLASFPQDLQKTNDKGEITFKSNRRATLCISSQVGCQMGCTFCATGTMGLSDNLLAGEILEQLYHANTIEPIRNVVFMGMGEPLDNYKAVIATIRAMTDVGVVPRLLTLAQDAPGISLALSLHAPTQEQRVQIVPTSKAWHIDRIMEATDAFMAMREAQSGSGARHKVVAEYVMIQGINDSEATAHATGELLRQREVWLNLIPYNPTAVPYDYKPPTQEAIDRFMEIVRSYGVTVMIRQELGQDIASACGQLVVESMAKGKAKAADSGEAAGSPGDLEDLMAPARAVRQRRTAKGAGRAQTASADQAGAGGESEAPAGPSRLMQILRILAAILLFVLIFLSLPTPVVL